MHISRRSLVPLLSLALGSTVLVVALPIAAQASVKNPTAASVIKATNKALLKQKGVHVAVDSTTSGVKTTVSVDIGSGYGTEKITSGKNTVTIIVTPKWAYLSGSKTGLISIMGLSAAQEKKVGTLWVTMKAATTPYESFSTNLTTTVLSHILPAAKGTKYSTDSTSKKNYELTWTTAATSSAVATKSVLKISSGSKTLPLSEKITSKSGGGSTTFSKWGEHVTETAPSSNDTVTYAKVLATK
jgi:hypothetical protein